MYSYGKLNQKDQIESIVQSETRIDDEHHVYLSAEPDFTGESYIGRDWPRPTPTYRVVTRRQAKQQLLMDGLLDDVQPAIDAITDDTQRRLVQIYWDDATEFEIDNPELVELANRLGLTEQGLKDTFKQAAKR